MVVVLALLVCDPLPPSLRLVEAACSGQHLGAISPAQGEKVKIYSGQCAGLINIEHDDIHVSFEEGSEIDSTADIQFPSSGTLRNITVAIHGGAWDLRTSSLFSSSSVSTVLVGSSLTFENLTVHSSGDDTIGLPNGPGLTSSNFTVENCTLTGGGGFSSRYGVAFGGTLTNTTVSISNSTLTTTSSSSAYGLYFHTLTNSTVTMSGLNVTTSTSSSLAVGLYLTARSGPRTELYSSAVTMSKCTLTTSSNAFAYGLYQPGTLTNSTVALSECTMTTSSATSAYGLRFHNTLTDSAVALNKCTLTTTSSSGRVSGSDEAISIYI